MRELLVRVGALSPSEWNDLSDDDLIAQCIYDLTATHDESLTTDTVICPDGEPTSPSMKKQATYLVDEAGQGVQVGTSERALPPDC